MQPTEVALEAALLVMRNGGSTIAADRSFSNILKGYGEEGIDAVWRLDFIAAIGSADSQPSTIMRLVGPIGANLFRASEVEILSRRAASGEVAVAAIEAEIERIKHLPSSYNRWLTVFVAAAAAACFSQIPGGDWGSFGITFVAGGVGQLLRSELQARKLAIAPTMLLSAGLSAMIAALGLRLGYSEVAPATMIASVAYLFPGLPLINGFMDMISHRYLLVGAERMLNAAFLFLVLAIAIAFAHAILL